MVNKVVLSLVLFSFATRAGSPQHERANRVLASPYSVRWTDSSQLR